MPNIFFSSHYSGTNTTLEKRTTFTQTNNSAKSNRELTTRNYITRDFHLFVAKTLSYIGPYKSASTNVEYARQNNIIRVRTMLTITSSRNRTPWQKQRHSRFTNTVTFNHSKSLMAFVCKCINFVTFYPCNVYRFTCARRSNILFI